MFKLENWSILRFTADPYQAPELWKQHLIGTVYGHPYIADGKIVSTSSIVGCEGEFIKTKSGSLYDLGKVNPEYEKEYPNARKRLFDSFTDN